MPPGYFDDGSVPHLPIAKSSIAADVARGLGATHKRLPPYLFYDAAGSRLYDGITELPEYYPTRVERGILDVHADEIVRRVLDGSPHPLRVVELGAGSARKSQLVLRAVVRAQGQCLFMPVDVSHSALQDAVDRLRVEEPKVLLQPLAASHEQAFDEIRKLGPRRLLMFIGSSIGNYDNDEAAALLAGAARSLAPGGALLLGTDWRKNPATLIAAYDDAQGVTAAFNKNLLTRINRELGGEFVLDRFAHRAIWNEAQSRIEMHLESLCRQSVRIAALDLTVPFEQGERIHTESSIKYDMPRVDQLLRAGGFLREHTFFDPERRFAVHLARVPVRDAVEGRDGRTGVSARR